jgi:hypothetical protein
MKSLNQDDLCPARRMAWGQLFGNCIEKTREACGRSVEEAAHLAGMETAEWVAIEAGWVPDPAHLHPMSDALGLRFDKIALLAFICQGAWEQ